MSKKYLCLGGIILDDVVFPDGRTAMSVLGGGGLYAAAGMRVWADDVGLFARVGPDFDFGLLDGLGLDCNAIHVTGLPTPRAWQLYEEDGTRTQIPRVSMDDWQAQLMPTLDSLPPVAGVTSAHMSGRGHEAEPKIAALLAETGMSLSLEPMLDADTSRDKRQAVLDLLPQVDIFSPGLGDAHLLLGERPARELLVTFANLGPRFVTLRRGALGSLVYDKQLERFWQVPAAPATVVDVTGAGNAYCGGFLVGLSRYNSVEQAAACAAVSAAITLEQLGPPVITPALQTKAQQRQAECLAQIQDVTEQMT